MQSRAIWNQHFPRIKYVYKNPRYVENKMMPTRCQFRVLHKIVRSGKEKYKCGRVSARLPLPRAKVESPFPFVFNLSVTPFFLDVNVCDVIRSYFGGFACQTRALARAWSERNSRDHFLREPRPTRGRENFHYKTVRRRPVVVTDRSICDVRRKIPRGED